MRFRSKAIPSFVSFLVCFAFVVSAASPAGAAEYTVSGDVDALREALWAATSGSDTIYVKPATSTAAYYSPITVTHAVTLIGLTSGGSRAWTPGTAGCSSSAPLIKNDGSLDNVVSLGASNIQMMGFQIDARSAAAVTATAIDGSYITLTYNTFRTGFTGAGTSDPANAIAIDYGNSASNLSIDSCSFIGQATNTSNWFYVGENGDDGTVADADFSNNSITNATAAMLTEGGIQRVVFRNNEFSNSWTLAPQSTIERPFSYILIDNPTGSGSIGGVTVTHNTFNPTSGNIDDIYGETAILLAEDITSGDWESNLALHCNNFLQQDVGSLDYPVVGFEDAASAGSGQISATNNWWGTGTANTGPGSFAAGGDAGAFADVSDEVTTAPWARAVIEGGSRAVLGAIDAVQEITGTHLISSHMSFEVDTDGVEAVTLLPTRYATAPTSTFSSGIAWFGVPVKSGAGSIEQMTVTFYTDDDDYELDFTNPIYWFDGGEWVACSSFAITTTAAREICVSSVSETWNCADLGPSVTLAITATHDMVGTITPTLWAITSTSMHSPVSPTYFFALAGSGSSSSSSSTTSSVSDDDDDATTSTTTSVTPTSSTTTTTSIVVTTSSTTTSLPTTTTTVILPRLSVTPAALDFAEDEYAKVLQIANTGSGVLDWSIDDNATEYDEGATGWVFAAVPAAGTITDTPQSVTVTVSRRMSVAGTYTAALPVESNGGSIGVDLSMETTGPELPGISVRPQFVLFLNTDVSEQTVDLRNPLSGSLTWEIADTIYHRGENWLRVTPLTGYTLDEIDAISLTVDRDNQRPGLYSATVPVLSNARNKNIIVVMRVTEGPELTLSRSMLFFLDSETTEQTFTITNEGAESLSWQIDPADIEYRGTEGWITSVSPLSGTVPTADDESTVTVVIDRGELGPGIYRAIVPITSNGGTRNVNVFMLVSFM